MRPTQRQRFLLAGAALVLVLVCSGIGAVAFNLASREEAPQVATVFTPEASPSPTGPVGTPPAVGTPVALTRTAPAQDDLALAAAGDLGPSHLVAVPAAVTGGTLSAITYTAVFENVGAPATVEATLTLPPELTVVETSAGGIYDPQSGTLAFRAVVLPATPITWTVQTFSDPLADAPLTARLRYRAADQPEIEVQTTTPVLAADVAPPPPEARITSARLAAGDVAEIVATAQQLLAASRAGTFDQLGATACPLVPAQADWRTALGVLAAAADQIGEITPTRLTLGERGVVTVHLAGDRDHPDVARLWLAEDATGWQVCDLQLQNEGLRAPQ